MFHLPEPVFGGQTLSSFERGFQPGDLIALKAENKSPTKRPWFYDNNRGIRSVEPGEVLVIVQVIARIDKISWNDKETERLVPVAFVVGKDTLSYVLLEYFDLIS